MKIFPPLRKSKMVCADEMCLKFFLFKIVDKSRRTNLQFLK